MSKIDKIIKRLKAKPKDFTYNELKNLLLHFGYKEFMKSGSARAFVNENTKHIIRLHKPHPKNVLKMYQVIEVIEELSKKDLI